MKYGLREDEFWRVWEFTVQKTPDMTGHFLLGAKIDDVIVEANQLPGKANFNKNNPNATPLKGSLDEADSEDA